MGEDAIYVLSLSQRRPMRPPNYPGVRSAFPEGYLPLCKTT